MDKKLRETTNLGVEIMNSKWQAKRKLSHVVMFNLSNISLKSPAPGMRSMPMIHRLKILLPNSNLILQNINMYDVKTNSFLTWYEMTYLKDQKLKEIELPRRWNNRKWADTVFIRYQETTKQNDNWQETFEKECASDNCPN